jgi:hypothetical protein
LYRSKNVTPIDGALSIEQEFSKICVAEHGAEAIARLFQYLFAVCDE